MAQIPKGKSRTSSALNSALTGLSARLAPLVREKLTATLISELEAIVARELPERVGTILARELPGQVDALINRALQSKQSSDQATRPEFYSPNNIVAGTSNGEYM